MELIDVYRLSADRAAQIIERIRHQDMNSPTPCSAWTVRLTLAALITKTRFYAAAPTQAQTTKPAIAGETVGDRPVEAFRDDAASVLAAFASPTTLARAMTLPMGDVTGSTVLEVALLDAFLHSWDLGKATGQTFVEDEPVLKAVDAAAHRLITDELRAKGEFAAPVPVPDGASDLDRLVAFAGRHPGWRRAKAPLHNS